MNEGREETGLSAACRGIFKGGRKLNFFDKAINSIAPVHGMKRMAARKTIQILNSGYSEGGASHTKRSMKGFTGRSESPKKDIEGNLNTLRNRSRLLFMNAPIATSALLTKRTNVVGSGLKLKSRIDHEYLGISEDEAERWERNVEREFGLWAESVHCDALRMNNFYKQQQIIFLGKLMNGDGFCLMKQFKATSYMPYGLRLHIIEADRVSTPNTVIGYNSSGELFEGINPANQNRIYSGVEVDKNGMTVAYHICSQYPNAVDISGAPAEWHRVEAFGKRTGRPNILHIYDAERAEQRRGVPMLAPVIEALKQLTRYTEAELMAAVISGMFTVFIKTEGPTSEIPVGEAIPQTAQEVSQDPNDYELGNGAIVSLNPGEKIEIADPKRPNTAFDSYVNSLCKQIGSALEIPKELLLKEFSSSYSASRGALLEAWKMFRMQREWLAEEFCQPVYESFLFEGVARGRIEAPGFFEDPVKRKAWSGADWNGAAMGTLDPTKEVNAAIRRVENGFSTREEETMGLTGGDYTKNARQLERENRMLRGKEEGGNDFGKEQNN